MEKDLQKENEYLKERIVFLKKVIELNQETISVSLNTNKKLVNSCREKESSRQHQHRNQQQ